MNIISSRQPAERLAVRRRALRRVVRRVAVLSGAAFVSGCQTFPDSVATMEPFLSSPKATADLIGDEASAAVERNRALLDIQRACGVAGPTADAEEGPNPACAASATSVHGRRAEAYRRWAEDEVRKLPAASETASGGG